MRRAELTLPHCVDSGFFVAVFWYSGSPAGASRLQFVRVASKDSSYPGKYQSCYSENGGPDNEFPLVRRFVFAVACLCIPILLTFLYCDWAIGGHGKRRALGFLLCGTGFLIGALGIGLLLLTGFRWSWGWLL